MEGGAGKIVWFNGFRIHFWERFPTLERIRSYPELYYFRKISMSFRNSLEIKKTFGGSDRGNGYVKFDKYVF